MNQNSKIMYVPDLARALGMTEGALRGHLNRESWPAAIPPPIKIGARWAWLIDGVNAWLQDKAAHPIPSNKPAPARPVGRPRKTKTMEP